MDNKVDTAVSQARLACTTAWIASPEETVQLLDELAFHSEGTKPFL